MVLFMVMVFSATFNNISVISWLSVYCWRESEYPEKPTCITWEFWWIIPISVLNLQAESKDQRIVNKVKKTSTIRSMVYLEHMNLTSRIRYQENRAKMRNELKYYFAIFNIWCVLKKSFSNINDEYENQSHTSRVVTQSRRILWFND